MVGLVGAGLLLLGLFQQKSESVFRADGSLNLFAGMNLMVWGAILCVLSLFVWRRKTNHASYIQNLRGKYQHLPLMETLKEMKREEKDC